MTDTFHGALKPSQWIYGTEMAKDQEYCTVTYMLYVNKLDGTEYYKAAIRSNTDTVKSFICADHWLVKILGCYYCPDTEEAIQHALLLKPDAIYSKYNCKFERKAQALRDGVDERRAKGRLNPEALEVRRWLKSHIKADPTILASLDTMLPQEQELFGKAKYVSRTNFHPGLTQEAIDKIPFVIETEHTSLSYKKGSSSAKQSTVHNLEVVEAEAPITALDATAKSTIKFSEYTTYTEYKAALSKVEGQLKEAKQKEEEKRAEADRLAKIAEQERYAQAKANQRKWDFINTELSKDNNYRSIYVQVLRSSGRPRLYPTSSSARADFDTFVLKHLEDLYNTKH